MARIIEGGAYCAYLRKSRADMEAESLGQGETLVRHEQLLRTFAARSGITIVQWYKEIVSGDTIAERPEIRRLLADVENALWDGVLVVDVDRLGRGDSIDQGTILQTFVLSSTLIITPDKTYDPTDDNDADFFEIRLFFSRREYNMIKKRMQRGRLASAMDGCYQGGRAPYGYERFKLSGRKGWSLRIVPEKAEIVRSVFEWYAHGNIGAGGIAHRLCAMDCKTDLGNDFTAASIRSMLKNRIYIGRITWNKRILKKQIRNGVRRSIRVRGDAPVDAPGLHEPIISLALWEKAQAVLTAREKTPAPLQTGAVNPLAGLVLCARCGKKMQLKPDPARCASYLICLTADCPTHSAQLSAVEEAVLAAAERWMHQISLSPAIPASDPASGSRQAAMARLHTGETALLRQLDSLHDLLEQGIYSPETFISRKTTVESRLRDIREQILSLGQQSPPAQDIPLITSITDAYRAAPSAADKNVLLRAIFAKIELQKDERCRRGEPVGTHLTLRIFPRLPDH